MCRVLLGNSFLARLNLNFLKTKRLKQKANDFSTMQLIRVFSSPRDSILRRFLNKMSETTILKRDWETTNDNNLFNDKAVMFLFELMVEPKNRVNS